MEALKFLKDSVARFRSMEITNVAFTLSLDRASLKGFEGDDSIDQGEIGMDETIGKTNENPLNLCLDAHISSDKGSDRFWACVEVQDKFLECAKAANAISDVDQFSANGSISVR
ncbi:unnamed protein product [Microthlaspi erraticum]|uniref:Uncharacterized protein n=1 Tax=Microthlaspi erraticum TaxID=1685480 RepID=A0A6D2I3J9_9BRAS|nr:unnamed protein product [Microthlaspi erraticum]